MANYVQLTSMPNKDICMYRVNSDLPIESVSSIGGSVSYSSLRVSIS